MLVETAMSTSHFPTIAAVSEEENKKIRVVSHFLSCSVEMALESGADEFFFVEL